MILGYAFGDKLSSEDTDPDVTDGRGCRLVVHYWADLQSGQPVEISCMGCPKLTKRSQPLVGQSSPYCKDVGRYCCLTISSDCRYVPWLRRYSRQSCAMVPKWRIFGELLRPVFLATRLQHVSDLHLKFALRPWCGCMVYIQSATAEIRRGKQKKDRR